MSTEDGSVNADRVNALVAVLSALLPARPGRILVVGCGTGAEAGLLARVYGAETIGIDLQLEVAFDPAAALPAQLIEMDAQALRFENASFDLIYSFHALEHIADPRRALAEMTRVLKPGGHYLIGTPNKSRLLGYIRSHATPFEKIYWNAYDWWKRLRGEWRNEAGAHAGFTRAELVGLCAASFGEGDDVSGRYYLARYPRRQRLVRRLMTSGLSRWTFPAVYVHGRRLQASP